MQIESPWFQQFKENSQKLFGRNLIVACRVVLLVVGFLVSAVGFWQLYRVNGNESSANQGADIVVCEKKPDFERVIIYVSGAVEEPGLFVLDVDQRVADAVVAAGGLSESADVVRVHKQINFAGYLSDGQSIYIPTAMETEEQLLQKMISKTDEDVAESDEPISINTSDIKMLQKLDGIGEVRAQKIVENRPFATLSELVTSKIISQTVFEKNEGKMTL